jgi:predicted GIY-YIG superfamily endonuclease
MYYVDILQSIEKPEHFYTGLTSNLKLRLEEHNSGKARHTNKYKPWKLKSYFAFCDKEAAERFEIFLKSGSGREFAKKHF